MTRIADIASAGRARFTRQMACTRIHDLLASHAAAIGARIIARLGVGEPASLKLRRATLEARAAGMVPIMRA